MISALIVKEGQKTFKESEVEIVQHLANDLRVNEIADKVGVKKKTMEARIAKIRSKTGCKSAAGLVYLFCKNGWIK